MSSEARGDDVYQPEYSDVGNRPTDDLDLENVIDEPGLDDTMEKGYSAPEQPLAVSKYGTTGAEQQAGESLDQRLAQEEPEPDALAPKAADDEPDDDSGLLDETAEGARDGTAPGEEAAMHVAGDGSGT